MAAIVPQSDLDVPSMPQSTGHSGELKRDVVLMVRTSPEGAAPQGILCKVSFMNSWFDPSFLCFSVWAPMDGMMGFDKPGEEKK